MRALAFALLITGLVANIQVTFAQSLVLSDVANLRGLNYGPFRDGESPNLGIYPTVAELQQDVVILAGATNLIQMYSSDHGFGAVVSYAAPYGLQVIPGCFLNGGSNDAEEVNALIDTLNANPNATNIPFALVGSEAVSEQGVAPSYLIDQINQVRSAQTGNRVLIATAEFPETWLQNPELADAVDVILVNIYPYYNGVPIGQAVDYLTQQFNLVKAAYPNKPVMIGETGWPSAGETITSIMGAAVASVQNEETYLAEVLNQTYNQGIGVLIFEVFDEAWKISATGQQNQGNFGMFTNQRNVVNGIPTGTPKGPVDNTFIGPALAAAVLPESRSVQVGVTATVFATIINQGPGNADACEIAPQTILPASFLYQTADARTNTLTGTANTPANIAQGASQSFLIAITPTAAFAATNVALDFFCSNASPAPIFSGLDTLELSGSATAEPDIVAVAASGDPGYVDISVSTSTGDFAVATVNLGADGTITAAAKTGSATLPVTLTVCQTNPTSGACLAAPSASVTTDIPPNAAPTFGVFVRGSGTVANLPAINRVFVTFTDAGGVLRGETSVAVRTQ